VNAFSSLFSLLSQQKHQTFDSDNLSLLFQSKEPNAKVICKYCGLHYTDKDDETSEEAICEYCKKEKSL
jgi:hypothetical protein